MKNRLTLIAAVVLIAGVAMTVFHGCGSSASDSTTTSSSSSTVTVKGAGS